MSRPHRTTAERLANLELGDREYFASLGPQAAADLAEQLSEENERIALDLGRRRRRLKALEVYLDRGLAEQGLASIAARREDGSEVLWVPQRDGTGFQRQPINRPRAGGGA